MKADPNTTAEIILDSENEYGDRLTTMKVVMPKYLVAEFDTHRAFSRNSASSRAIPIEKQLKKVSNHPFLPCRLGKNQKGMQAYDELAEPHRTNALGLISDLKDELLCYAQLLHEQGLHKQVIGRYLEPFLYTTILVSSTDYYNFFALRAHYEAEPHFQTAAYRMLEAYLNSKPQQLKAYEWHIPYRDRMPEELPFHKKIKVATARCARVSYETQDGEININSDLELHDRLMKAGHWSPFEHCAMVPSMKGYQSGNFQGFIQYRKTFPNERRTKDNTDLQLILANKPEWI